jgi:aerobic-type carbon monoxide dehydrogenase small subunit (CoxS/CutS family)
LLLINLFFMELLINGKKYSAREDARESLLSVLRNDLDLTGSKYGCGEGQCGACTVLLDGKAVRSCQTPVGTVGARAITTIEGLETEGRLHPVQEAFLKVDAFQCGYCASGMVMSAVALLRQHPQPSDQQILDFMNGNICRCGTYPLVMKAIQEASKA